MNFDYIERSLEPVLRRAASEFPAVVLTGPRQSGKTTILKRLFAESHGYVTMDFPDVRAAAVADPRGFLAANPPPIIIDEIQFAPDLLHYIKAHIDERRSERGMFLLTGSQNLALAEQVTETLAGRTAMLKLLPLTHSEAAGFPGTMLPWEIHNPQVHSTRAHIDLWQDLIRGFYPELVSEPSRDFNLWHNAYIQTYLERDVRTLRQVGDLAQFQLFFRALAACCGQLLNLTSLARDMGIAVNTVKHWLSVLEATFQIVILRPYFENMGKRLVKTPKVYFMDTGTLCSLTGLKNPQHAADGPMGGAIFENAVVTEIYKRLLHRGDTPQIYFWRTSYGVEVDIIVQFEGKIIPVEVKKTGTPKPKMAEGIKTLFENFGDRIQKGFVIHTGDVHLPLAPKITALPFGEL
jgi:hypothetical protein